MNPIKQKNVDEAWSGRAILHVDMDAFYAAVEVLDNPALTGRPVVVGGRPESRGVVAAASYAARRFGVRSAMPMSRAVRLCPDAVILPPRMARYAEMSATIRDIFERFTPLVEPLSLDEAFLDVTGSQSLFGAGPIIGREIKTAIRRETGLIASVGVAPNKFLAKIASDIDKPDGFRVIEPDSVHDFLDPLPVSRLWGVGPATQRELDRHAIHTIAQLRRLPLEAAEHLFGRHGRHLALLARGEDRRPVVPESEAKSISNETTFAEDLTDNSVLHAWLQQLAEQVGWRLRRAGLEGRTIQIKVRFADFTTLTRSQSLPQPTASSREILRVAKQLFQTRLPSPRPSVRLLGVGVSGFEDSAPQADLFNDGQRRADARLDGVVDAIRQRYGKGAARRGRDPEHA